MKREEIISGIKQAEGNAREMVDSARAASARQLADAGREAERILEAAGAEARKRSDAAVGKALSEISAECDSILQGGLNDLELYREKARRNVPKAREFLLKCFEDAFHA